MPFLTRGAGASIGDGSLDRVVRRGRLCIITSLLMAPPEAQPGAVGAPQDRYHIAIAEMIAAELSVGLDVVSEPDPDRFIPRLLQGDVDVIMPALVSRMVATTMLLSRPYAALDAAILGPRTPRRRASGFDGRRIGVLASYARAFGASLPVPNHAVQVAYPSLAAMEAALLAGEVEAVMAPSLQARGIIQRNPGVDLAIHFTLATFTYAAGVRFGAHDLLLAVNACLAEGIHDGEIAALFRRETGLTLPPLAPL